MDLGEPIREIEISPREDPVPRERPAEPTRDPAPPPRREEPVPA